MKLAITKSKIFEQLFSVFLFNIFFISILIFLLIFKSNIFIIIILFIFTLLQLLPSIFLYLNYKNINGNQIIEITNNQIKIENLTTLRHSELVLNQEVKIILTAVFAAQLLHINFKYFCIKNEFGEIYYFTSLLDRFEDLGIYLSKYGYETNSVWFPFIPIDKK